jgi:metal-responsive CopG/Arc/MetJ family transcriptional regulator
MIQPKVKPKMRTLTVSLPESVLAALDEYCRLLGADTDRTYIVSEALRLVISRDKRFKNGQEPVGPRSARTAGA